MNLSYREADANMKLRGPLVLTLSWEVMADAHSSFLNIINSSEG
jgi:hypothetical protein